MITISCAALLTQFYKIQLVTGALCTTVWKNICVILKFKNYVNSFCLDRNARKTRNFWNNSWLLECSNKVKPEIKHLCCYSDTSGGHNRNQNIAALCLYLVQITDLEVIENKFLESGHTFMLLPWKFDYPMHNYRKSYTVCSGSKYLKCLDQRDFVIKMFGK